MRIMNIETLQEKINRVADDKCEREVEAAFSSLESAVSKCGSLYDSRKWEFGEEANLPPIYLLKEIKKHFINHGKAAYRSAESQELLDKLAAVQDQISYLESSINH